MATGHDISDIDTDPDDLLTFLRPFGYVENDPVVCSLGVLGLHLGNRHAAEGPSADRFGAVVTVSTDRQSGTTHHRPLVDGPGNDWAAFVAAVDTARELARAEKRVLVHCDAGISRSTAVLTTTIAAETGRSFRESLATVESARPSAVPNPAVVELSVCYLAARG